MPLTSTQTGTVGEQLFAACVTLTSNGELELFKPETDDDHTDVAAGRRGGRPALSIQVKTALSLNRKGLASARMAFPEGRPRESPYFVYAILYVADAAVECGWLVPSPEFDRLAYRSRGRRGKGIQLVFLGAPGREDHWTPYRCPRLELGSRLAALIDALPPGTPPRVPGAHLLLRRSS